MVSKKAISPVVAIALLLVVSVVAVVGFQNWYTGFQSGVLVDTEQRSAQTSSGVNVEYIDQNQVYITNAGTQNVSLSTVKINGVDCEFNTTLTPGINEVDVSLCLNDTTSGTQEVVLVTDSGIVQEKSFLENRNNSFVRIVINNSYMVAPNSTEVSLAFATVGTDVPGADDVDNGLQNTLDLIANGSSHPAAEYCYNLVYGGYDDWYLPAFNQLYRMSYDRNGLLSQDSSGNTFQSNYYYSSTEYTTNVGTVHILNEADYTGQTKSVAIPVRCIRDYK